MSVIASRHARGESDEDPPENTVHIKEGPKMTDRIAEKDITEKNANGQTVVLVHAGAPIPEGLEVADDGVTVVDPDASAPATGSRSRSKKAD